MIRRLLPTLLVIVILVAALLPATAHAATAAPTDFYLQVTPSPLVTTLKPGQPTELELKIRNAGTSTENLKIEPRSFTFNNSTGEVHLDDTSPPDIAQWVNFSAQTFSIKPGDWFTQKVRIALPKDAGFSYSFALLISRQSNPRPTEGGRLIKGSLAVFTLVNVDRPGATRQLQVAHFTTPKKFYEYLPTGLDVSFKNTGNSIVQPYGNIYLQRSGSKTDSDPITTLSVNEKRSYILPGSVRTVHANWDDGFPAYKTTTDSSGKVTTKLVWDWSKVADLRIGKYTAKLVAVYNDGKRDVPIEQEVSFWVIPWKILIGITLVVLLVLFSIASLIWRIVKFTRKKAHRRAAKKADKKTDSVSDKPTDKTDE